MGPSVDARSDDRVPNDWLEMLIILACISGITGLGVSLYYLSQGL